MASNFILNALLKHKVSAFLRNLCRYRLRKIAQLLRDLKEPKWAYFFKFIPL